MVDWIRVEETQSANPRRFLSPSDMAPINQSSAHPPTSHRVGSFCNGTNTTSSTLRQRTPSPPASRRHRAGGFLSLCHGMIVESDAPPKQVESIYCVCLPRIQISGSDHPPFQNTFPLFAHIRIKIRRFDRLNLCNASDGLPRDSRSPYRVG